ncbi:hypothetical protein [Jiella mangrovi]|uniref:DUF4239 domain-containing protein n=1 Tax=Jiella mangrovi TaxID=2821407 RepID=A0ABS4BDV0_9HYPH|nr:hypothetical protein [Jiella mangrovi]MBP0614239.1 hypothetical protein [Jiella mangrovi]
MRKATILAGLMVLALISALANYVGLDMMIGSDSLWWKGFSAVIAFGVFVTIALFWHMAFAIVPDLPRLRDRIAGWVTTYAGAAFLVGLSTLWNVAALGGNEARDASLSGTVASVERFLADTLSTSADFQPLILSLGRLDSELTMKSDCERTAGCITGSAGAGGISALIGQLASKAKTIKGSAEEAQTVYAKLGERGAACIATMRVMANSGATIEDRAEGVAQGADCVNQVAAELQNIEAGPSIRHALLTFTDGAILPITIKTDKQRAAADAALAGISQTAASLAGSIPEVSAAQPEPPVIARPNPIQAVLTHYDAILPAWVTGISLDLVPLVLLSFLSIRAAADRVNPEARLLRTPLGDVLDSAKLVERIGAHRPGTVEYLPPERTPPGFFFPPRRKRS